MGLAKINVGGTWRDHATVQSCVGTCGSLCTGGCTDECTSGCGTGCSSCSGCNSSCNDNCTEQCKEVCKGGCTGGCDTACTDGCNNMCSADSCTKSCNSNCSGECEENQCTQSCGNNCSGECIAGCQGTCNGCLETCRANNAGFISNTCNDCERSSTIATGCRSGCQIGCSTYCTGCNTGCGSKCGSECTSETVSVVNSTADKYGNSGNKFTAYCGEIIQYVDGDTYGPSGEGQAGEYIVSPSIYVKVGNYFKISKSVSIRGGGDLARSRIRSHIYRIIRYYKQYMKYERTWRNYGTC